MWTDKAGKVSWEESRKVRLGLGKVAGRGWGIPGCSIPGGGKCWNRGVFLKIIQQGSYIISHTRDRGLTCLGESSTRCLVQLLPSEFLFDGVPLTFLLHPRHNTWKTSPHCPTYSSQSLVTTNVSQHLKLPCSVASPTSSLSTTGLSRSEDETNVRLANLCTKVKKDFLFHSTSNNSNNLARV